VVIPYDKLPTVVAAINRGERPLGIYVFSDDSSVIDYVLKNTKSGGVSINACAAQTSIPSMAFGGVGYSGMGRHGGYGGFCEFSNPKGVFTRATDDDLMEMWQPPYARAQAIVESLFTQMQI